MRSLTLIAAVALLLTSAGVASASDGAARGRFDRPQDGFARPGTGLGETTPERVRLDPAPIDAAWREIQAGAAPTGETKPTYAGGVLTYGHQGNIVFNKAFGKAVKYGPGETELPPAEQIDARPDTIYDIASISKLFTSIVVVQQVERGTIDLDAPVASYVPEFAENDKAAITVRQLLTHTSGLPPFLALWRDYPDPDSRLNAALTAKPQKPAGTAYIYSDLNLIALAEVAGRVTGRPLDELVADGITKPLKMTDTGYNPDPALRPRIAATEEQITPARGVVWGEVHDENAWSLGGVAGHAGVFSTARDLARLAQAMLNGGELDGVRILTRDSVEAMITDENQAFPGDAHGLGFEIDQHWYMDGLSGPRTVGHTGYTGTSLVIDFDSRSFAILLTNRVHPSRSWANANPARRAAARGLADALAVRPPAGPAAWRTERTPDAELTLTLAVPAGTRALTWQTLIDLEPTDPLAVQYRRGDGTWAPLPGARTETTGRTWRRETAELPAGTTAVRWRQTTDAVAFGRGVFVDDVRADDAEPITESDARWSADGWSAVRR